ncbi:sperm-associated antigen 1 isoform X4 [Pseudorasbora parva]|uniref:sperm-associated antigen 1 isoform X4 n=1 Tax=Pseudorasbora parva TaxID=51549 RepID=UPI00351DEE84
MSAPGSSCGSVPVEHLDYSFIQSCSDLKHLEKILRVLRSGQQGFFPHLIEFCERHIEKLEPKSRVLRKENRAASAADLSTEEWRSISEDLQMWERSIRSEELELKRRPIISDAEILPPVRSSEGPVQVHSSDGPVQVQRSVSTAVKTERAAGVPRPYADWDRFDVEAECSKIDESPTHIICPERPTVKQTVNSTGQSVCVCVTDWQCVPPAQDRAALARREKEKGNEAFRAGEYEEAVAFYSRSLSLVSSVAALNNRAQAHIRLERWSAALTDCEEVLQLEPDNAKALLRRATVHKHLGRLQESHDDLRAVLQMEPHNPTALLLADGAEQERRGTGRKILIQEVCEEEDEDAQEAERGILRNAYSAGHAPAGAPPSGHAPADAPPSGHAPAGAPPSGHAPADAPPSGHAPTDAPPSGHAPTGAPPSGHAPTGAPPSGHAPADAPPSGHAPADAPPSGHAPTGAPPSGHAPADAPPSAHAPADAPPSGHAPTGAPPSGHAPTGAPPSGHASADAPPSGHAPTGAPPSGHAHLENGEKHTQSISEHTAAESQLLKDEAGRLFRSGSFQEAAERYTHCLQLQPHECAAYTSRALCYIKLQRFTEARQDCDSALQLQPTNKKAFYRRALANKGLKDYGACRLDLQQVLRLDASVTEAAQQLMELTHPSGARRIIHITEVDDADEDEGGAHTPAVHNEEEKHPPTFPDRH